MCHYYQTLSFNKKTVLLLIPDDISIQFSCKFFNMTSQNSKVASLIKARIVLIESLLIIKINTKTVITLLMITMIMMMLIYQMIMIK